MYHIYALRAGNVESMTYQATDYGRVQVVRLRRESVPEAFRAVRRLRQLGWVVKVKVVS